MKKFPAACSLNSFSPGSGAPRRHRRGIALLIVIGLTAMLMLLGAAFAIYMRTERMASGNFKNDVRARQLLHVALARAMDTVETSCNNAIYPPFDVLYPTNSGGGVVDAALTSWGATNYLPRGAFVTSSWASVNANIGWVPLTVGQAGSFEDVRYAYVVLNVSGLFDANQVGISGARGAGTNVQEIDLSDVPDANNLPAAPSFQTMPNLFTTGATNNFVVFQPYLRTNVLVDLSGDEDALMGRRADIIQALKACGINNSTELVFSNLLDYVDAGNIPKDLASSCTEKVPMINEIRKKDRFVITVNTGTTNLQYRSYMDVECWYPFMEPAANDYWLAYQIDFTVVPSNFPAPASVSGQQRLILGASGFYHLPSEIACLSSSQPLGSSDLSSTVRIDAHVRFQVYEGAFGVGTIVDASPYPTNQPLSVVGTASLLLGSLPIGSSWTTNGLECFDPRCNWMASSASRQWIGYNASSLAGTIGAVNQRTATYLGTALYFKTTDGTNTGMYVANRPLQSVGELTYLLRSGVPSYNNNPKDLWTTIRLVPPPGDTSSTLIDPIFDHFTIGSSRTSAATPDGPARDWGLVNANSFNSNIWKAVFTDMSINRPGKDAGFVSVPDPGALATVWLNASTGSIANLTDFCRVGWAEHGFCNGPIFNGYTALEKESFFINTAGLLGVRQNTFVIMLYGEPTRSIYINNNRNISPLSGIRAVATVWRDPVLEPGAVAGQPHRWFVRSFDILKNE